MAKPITKFLDDVQILQFKMQKDADKVLEAIDIDEMLKVGVRPYLKSLAQAYLKEHNKEIKKAYELGEKFADGVERISKKDK